MTTAGRAERAATPSRPDDGFSARAHRVIPGGAHTYSRGDDQFPALAPRGFVRGKGARVWDLDGTEFVDWGMGINNVLVGHAEDAIDDAAVDALRDGQAFSRPSPLEVEAAEALVSLFAGMEMAKFAKNGSDANDAALRLARAITGRDLVAYDASAPFLSIDDWFIGTTVVGAGVPERVRSLSVPFRFNDTESVERIFADHDRQIAAVVMEVCREVRPDPAFLRRLRELCTAQGTVLVFDEIVTAFRYDLSGAHSLFGVRPDLLTVGKGMANGYALAALVGPRALLDRGGLDHPYDRVFLLSTTNGPERSALAACRATIAFYRTHDVIGAIHRTGRRVREAIARAAERHGIAARLGTAGDFDCRPVLRTMDERGVPSSELRALLLQELARRQVFMPWICPSFRHGDDDLERTAAAFDGAAEVYARALERGSVDGLLVGPAVRPVFRRLNADPG